MATSNAGMLQQTVVRFPGEALAYHVKQPPAVRNVTDTELAIPINMLLVFPQRIPQPLRRARRRHPPEIVSRCQVLSGRETQVLC